MGGFMGSIAAAVLGSMESFTAPLRIASVAPPPAGTGRRNQARSRYTGADLRRIRREGQARECARRLRQKAGRTC